MIRLVAIHHEDLLPDTHLHLAKVNATHCSNSSFSCYATYIYIYSSPCAFDSLWTGTGGWRPTASSWASLLGSEGLESSREHVQESRHVGGGVQGQLWSCICGGEGGESSYLSHNGSGGKSQTDKTFWFELLYRKIFPSDGYPVLNLLYAVSFRLPNNMEVKMLLNKSLICGQRV